MSFHEDYYWTAGDDWQINAQLVDHDGVPFDLSIGSPVIKWSLISAAGNLVLTEADCEIVIADAVNGLVAIRILAAKTSPLETGRYTDQIRIVYGGMTSTLSHGANWITNNAWIAPTGASAQMKLASFH